MWIMTKQTRVFLFLLILVCVTTSVLGAETRLNITISELISENVTFAQNFYLQEQQNYVLIEGEINVTNPSNNTVFDIYVYLINTRIFDGNITYESGRNASHYGENNYITYARVSINGTYTGAEPNNTLPASWTVQVKKVPNNLTIFIPELRGGESTLLNYT